MNDIKVYTTVSKEVLDLYNEIMDGNNEDPFTIRENGVGDCEEGILRDEAVDGEVTVDFAGLLGEMEYNFLDKQADMANDAVANMEITPQKAAGIIRHNKALIKKFEKAYTGDVEKWLVTTI